KIHRISQQQKMNIETLINTLFPDNFIQSVMSGPMSREVVQKVTIRPLMIKNQLVYQITEQKGNQAVHHNVAVQLCREYFENHILLYKQTLINTADADYQ